MLAYQKLSIRINHKTRHHTPNPQKKKRKKKKKTRQPPTLWKVGSTTKNITNYKPPTSIFKGSLPSFLRRVLRLYFNGAPQNKGLPPLTLENAGLQLNRLSVIAKKIRAESSLLDPDKNLELEFEQSIVPLLQFFISHSLISHPSKDQLAILCYLTMAELRYALARPTREIIQAINQRTPENKIRLTKKLNALISTYNLLQKNSQWIYSLIPTPSPIVELEAIKQTSLIYSRSSALSDSKLDVEFISKAKNSDYSEKLEQLISTTNYRLIFYKQKADYLQEQNAQTPDAQESILTTKIMLYSNYTSFKLNLLQMIDSLVFQISKKLAAQFQKEINKCNTAEQNEISEALKATKSLCAMGLEMSGTPLKIKQLKLSIENKIEGLEGISALIKSHETLIERIAKNLKQSGEHSSIQILNLEELNKAKSLPPTNSPSSKSNPSACSPRLFFNPSSIKQQKAEAINTKIKYKNLLVRNLKGDRFYFFDRKGVKHPVQYSDTHKLYACIVQDDKMLVKEANSKLQNYFNRFSHHQLVSRMSIREQRMSSTRKRLYSMKIRLNSGNRLFGLECYFMIDGCQNKLILFNDHRKHNKQYLEILNGNTLPKAKLIQVKQQLITSTSTSTSTNIGTPAI